MDFYPLKFEPIYKERIWGGQKLRDIFDKNIPQNTKIGESWELADLPNDKSVVANGHFAGRTLEQLIQEYPQQITANAEFKLPFPLLIKILDAENILSVQVHPDPKTCKQMQTGDPKTECWYIIAADEKAFIYKGLKKGTTKEQFAAAIENGSVEKLLEKIPVKKGQCHFLPAGTLHAIGPGLLIAEIQTPSDTTYRVFDFNRVDDTGNPRQLHIPQALQSIHFDQSPDELTVTTEGMLVNSPFFKIKKEYQPKDSQLTIEPSEMKTLIILAGSGEILSNNQASTTFKPGRTLLIPAACQGTIRFDQVTEYLTVTI